MTLSKEADIDRGDIGLFGMTIQRIPTRILATLLGCGLWLVLIQGCGIDMDSRSSFGSISISPSIHSTRISQGVDALVAGEFRSANTAFNILLVDIPRDPLVNFLNGFAYQAAAVGEGYEWDLAKTGYQLAQKFDPFLWQASYMLGLMSLKERDALSAAAAFAQAAIVGTFESEPLFGLAAAACIAGDLGTAYLAVRRALELEPEPDTDARRIAAITFAGVGDFEAARQQLEAMEAAGAPAKALERVRRQMRYWEKHYARIERIVGQDNASANTESSPIEYAFTLPSEGNGDDGFDRMAVIEAVIVSMGTLSGYGRGINLLEGLSVQLEGNLINVVRERTREFEELTVDTRTQTRDITLSIPVVQYSLNIINSLTNLSRIVGRPTVLTLDGESSEFFLGQEITLLTGGDFESVAEKDVGLSLVVSPEFLSPNTVKLRVETDLSSLQNSIPEGLPLGGLQIDKARSNVSAVMEFGQTLAVSAATQIQVLDREQGVPGLRQTPLLDIVFSEQTSGVLKTTLLVLLTLKPPQPRDSFSISVGDVWQTEPLRRLKRRLYQWEDSTLPAAVQGNLELLRTTEVPIAIRPADVQPYQPVRDNRLGEFQTERRRQFLEAVVQEAMIH
ncbi:MAG: hypothetical protein V2J55_20230 [Candidatus Competibacteraceae bacterium]|jgi:hypothetical protein|nr:hypothetical protein [Candidatus Competibacteraceae bacterium]